MSEMEFFDGFEWAVPKAFAAAVHACRFEQGDVLYSDSGAYDASKRTKHPAAFHVQVLDPPRTNRATAGDGEGQRFFSNWESPVTFEWMDYRKGETYERKATQGDLFTWLWRGDRGPLEFGDLEVELERPLLLRDLSPRVEEHLDAVTDAFFKASGRNVSKGKRGTKQHLFAMAIDQSSDASRVKGERIVNALGKNFGVEQHAFSPRELMLEDASKFHPALEVFAVMIGCSEAKEIEDELRGVLYVGGKGAEKEGGRFQLARHGSLTALP